MRRGVLLIAAILSAGGCSAPAAKVAKVRAVGTSPVPVNGSAAERIAYADGQFALGNVALALEAYRRAARQEPASIGALLGMAQCYDQMGRFDLSRRTYESALALEPADAAILARFASSLTQSGDPAGAAQVRREIASRVASAVSIPLAPPTTLAVSQDRASPPAGSAVSVALDSLAERPGPRLERLSLGEVALVTTGGVRWAALRPPQQSRGDVRILNAARYPGLAARTREALLRLGWRRLAIGDAPAVRERSLVLYPAGRRAAAERLARQIGAATVGQGRADEIVMLLGRDTARADGVRAGR